MKRGAVLLLSLAVIACQDTSEPLTPGTAESSRSAVDQGARIVPGQYIVVFEPGVRDAPGLARRLSQTHGGSLRATYQHAIKGFAARLPNAAVTALRKNPNVAYIEPDRQVRLFATQTNPPSWGLDRADQRDLPLSDSYTYNNNGSGANIYILDTGVRRSHNDFGGRVQYIPNGTNGDFVLDGHGSAEDCHGHGTHVAGTAAGSSFGIAKGASIWAGRVVNCSGSGVVSMAIDGVDWITGNGQKPAVVNMSLGYGDVQSLRDAVENSIAAGYNYAVAAGNGNFAGIPQDACSESPGGAPNALTVGATTINDAEASFSNYGTCVDILAPGVSITSAWFDGDNATETISGTSMATPHVAGAVALYLSANPSATPAQVAQALTDNASANRIDLHRRSSGGGTPNLLLFTGFIGGGGGDTNNPPTADFDHSCADLACDFTDASTDSDGSIASWSWDFGDGATSTAQNPSHTYASAGTYTVTLTVTDNDGAEDSVSRSVEVTDGSGGGISLTASGSKVRGRQTVDLTWSGATSASVDVYRDGDVIATTANDGSYIDAIGARGGATYVYQVCEAGTSTCSNAETVVF